MVATLRSQEAPSHATSSRSARVVDAEALPGPRANRILETARWFRSPTQYLAANHARHGEAFSTHLIQFGPITFFNHPRAIKAIFTSDPDILRGGEGNGPLREIFGDHSLLVIDGKPHLRQRRLLMPPFHGKRLKACADQMQTITAAALAQWPRDTTFAVHPHMLDITLQVILSTVFGLEDPTQGELPKALKEQLEFVSGPWGPLLITPKLRKDLGPWSPWGRFLRQSNHIDGLLRKHIEARQAGASAEPRSDILAMMLEARDEDGLPMTYEELRDELLTLLVAGHETTATAMSWAFEQLLSHPQTLLRLRAEIDTVLGPERAVTSDDLRNMPYLDAVVKEVLRIRPVVGIVLRKASADTVVDGIRIPKGARVGVSISATHKRPDLYPDPERFQPERFLGHKPDPYAYMPFGGGTRRCIGRAFALFQMKVMLATIVQRAQIELVEPGPIALKQRSITTAPKTGTRIRVRGE